MNRILTFATVILTILTIGFAIALAFAFSDFSYITKDKLISCNSNNICARFVTFQHINRVESKIMVSKGTNSSSNYFINLPKENLNENNIEVLWETDEASIKVGNIEIHLHEKEFKSFN